MRSDSISSQNPSGSLHPVHIALIILLLFLTGWVGGFLYNGGGKWLADAFRLAYITQFQVRSGATDGSRTYYVSSTDTAALETWLENESGITRVDRTFIDNLLLVSVSDDSPDTFNRLRDNPLVSVVTTIPLFCH
jgi:hypothetical protein